MNRTNKRDTIIYWLTTGAVCAKLGRKALLCDISEEYTSITEKRLGIGRTQRPK